MATEDEIYNYIKTNNGKLDSIDIADHFDLDLQSIWDVCDRLYDDGKIRFSAEGFHVVSE